MSQSIRDAEKREEARLQAAADAIKEAVAQHSWRIADLSEHLVPEPPFTNVHFSRAFTALLLAGEIELTGDRHVQAAVKP